jgi:hypothetical protein
MLATNMEQGMEMSHTRLETVLAPETATPPLTIPVVIKQDWGR